MPALRFSSPMPLDWVPWLHWAATTASITTVTSEFLHNIKSDTTVTGRRPTSTQIPSARLCMWLWTQGLANKPEKINSISISKIIFHFSHSDRKREWKQPQSVFTITWPKDLFFFIHFCVEWMSYCNDCAVLWPPEEPLGLMNTLYECARNYDRRPKDFLARYSHFRCKVILSLIKNRNA